MKFWALLNASDGPGSAGWAGGQAGDVKGKGRARGEGLVRCLMSDSDDTADAAAAAAAVVVQVLVRKQQGGANKGMSRGLEAVRVTAEGMLPCAWNEVEGLQSLGRGYVPEPEPVQEVRPPNRRAVSYPPIVLLLHLGSTTHHSNTSRSTSPSRPRNKPRAPPYRSRTRTKVRFFPRRFPISSILDAHPHARVIGDEPPMTREPTAVGGGIIFEPGSEDDMDDDDPDEDLDF